MKDNRFGIKKYYSRNATDFSNCIFVGNYIYGFFYINRVIKSNRFGIRIKKIYEGE